MHNTERMAFGGVTPEEVVKEHIIDCDASPYTPNGWKFKDHQKGGQLKFDASQIELYFSTAQKNRRSSSDGSKLKKELASTSVLNANVLDYLLAHTELIPEDWKDKDIFFWGTTYRDSDGNQCVRCLSWNGVKWFWSSRWIASSWFDSSPAALSAS